MIIPPNSGMITVLRDLWYPALVDYLNSRFWVFAQNSLHPCTKNLLTNKLAPHIVETGTGTGFDCLFIKQQQPQG